GCGFDTAGGVKAAAHAFIRDPVRVASAIESHSIAAVLAGEALDAALNCDTFVIAIRAIAIVRAMVLPDGTLIATAPCLIRMARIRESGRADEHRNCECCC